MLALSVLCAGLALAFSAPPGAATFSLLACLTALVLGPRFELDRLAQAMASVAALVVGVILARLTASPEEVEVMLSERTLLLGMPMLAIAAARACMVRPHYGEKLTLLAALVALTASGRAQSGLVFPLLAAGCLLFGLLALRVHDSARAPLRELQLRHYLGVAFGIAMAAGLAGFATWSLPRVHEEVMRRMEDRFEQKRTGFSTSMSLGSMRGMLQSDTVVLRVRGGSPPLLRGVVFSTYVEKLALWEAGAEQLPEVVETRPEPEDPAGYVETEYARRRPREQPYFLPLGAHELVSDSGFFDRDPLGIVKPSEKAVAKRIWFREGDPPRTPRPRLDELDVPRGLSSTLSAVLSDWGVPGRPAREQLSILHERLTTDYRYSLEVERPRRTDPIVDFLTRNKAGHCEYFASAFALLARSARIPARVVAGFRVEERSPLGYLIVRERNAHSWVEVWIDDHWETWDPTPMADHAVALETPWASALFDGLRTGWEAVDDWFGRRSAFELSLALVALVGALVLTRALRNRRRGERAVADATPAELALLGAALQRAGVTFGAGDTLGTLQRRVEVAREVDEEVRTEIAGALARYQRFRYGREGSAGEALAGLRQAAGRLKA